MVGPYALYNDLLYAGVSDTKTKPCKHSVDVYIHRNINREALNRLSFPRGSNS